ncbi:MAG TPA: hypothetical protein VFF78_06035 [Anaerolineaceae bacterium]|nr:hypothetical protein [Anaerolineaceae bacterium]
MNPTMMIFLFSRLADETPDSGGDMLAGYAVIFVILLVYILSLVLRFRRLKGEQALLASSAEETQNEG